LEQLEATVATTLVRQIRQLAGLGRAIPEDMVSLIRRRFPPVKEGKAESHPWDREDVILVTAAGLARKQDEIHHHVNVKIRENAVAIGRAAELGDLSENSEYKFALEERDLLRARLAQMNAEVAAAQVLSPGDVPTDYLGVGTKAIFERVTDGERYEMTVLGPWEADAAARWFNYKAPLCRKVLGKRIGDMVEFNHSGAVGIYRLVALENALTPKAS
jgi:transcription elongation GreA/GreB family factor